MDEKKVKGKKKKKFLGLGKATGRLVDEKKVKGKTEKKKKKRKRESFWIWVKQHGIKYTY